MITFPEGIPTTRFTTPSPRPTHKPFLVARKASTFAPILFPKLFSFFHVFTPLLVIYLFIHYLTSIEQFLGNFIFILG